MRRVQGLGPPPSSEPAPVWGVTTIVNPDRNRDECSEGSQFSVRCTGLSLAYHGPLEQISTPLIAACQATFGRDFVQRQETVWLLGR